MPAPTVFIQTHFQMKLCKKYGPKSRTTLLPIFPPNWGLVNGLVENE